MTISPKPAEPPRDREPRGWKLVCRLACFGMGLGALTGGLATAVETVLILFYRSHLGLEVIALVAAWWVLVGAVGGLVLSILVLPIALVWRGRGGFVLLGGVMLAAGIAAYSINVAPNLVPGDPLGVSVVLKDWFLLVWGGVVGTVAALLAARLSRAGVGMAFVLSTCGAFFSAGIAHYVPHTASAYTLVAGPIFLAVAACLLYDRLSGGKARRLVPAAVVFVYCAGLLAAAVYRGELAKGPIDLHLNPEPAKTAMLAGKANVLLITLDTTRADHMSLCGYEFQTTPNLDKLAADCRFFPNGVAANSWTLPTHASIFTGKYPRAHGAHGAASQGRLLVDRSPITAFPLAASHVTLAELLTSKGYNTAGFSANYVWLARQFGLHRGFGYFSDKPRFMAFVDSQTPLYKRGLGWMDALLGFNGKLRQTYWSARSVSRFGSRWLKKNSQTPFFLFLNYMDPHEPYCPPPPFDHVQGEGVSYSWEIANLPSWRTFHDGYIRDGGEISDEFRKQIYNQYDGEIAYMDHWLGRLIDDLKRMKLYDDTLIIVASDHGEFMGEHRLLNHGLGLFEGGIRVPILVKYPNQEHAGEVVEERVTVVSIFATVLDVLRLPNPVAECEPLGSSTQPVLAEDYENGANVKRYGKRFRRHQTAIYLDDWKFIRRSHGNHALFNLADDPGETKNLFRTEGEVAGKLASRIAVWEEATALFDSASEADRPRSKEVEDRMRALGYLGGGN